MTKRALFALLSLSALGLSACDSDPTYYFSFESAALEEPPPTPGNNTVEDVGSGVVAITRYTVAPCFGDRLGGQGRRSGNELTLTVTRVAASPCTNEQDRHFRYEAVFGNVDIGTYQVRVIENINGSPQVVQETSLRVD